MSVVSAVCRQVGVSATRSRV